MSFQLREHLHCAPKPREVSFGILEEKTVTAAVARQKASPDVEKKLLKLIKLN
jgi:hypothetical protein